MANLEKVIQGLNALYDSMHKHQCYACSYEFIETANEFGTNIIADAIEILEEQPEVVRCKDCKWFHQAFKSEGRCLKHDNDYHEPNWFCADGERK